MNKLLLILCIILFAIPEGCKKYEDGPCISIYKPIGRLTAGEDGLTWHVWSYKVNGIQKIYEYNDSCGCELTFSDKRKKILYISNCVFSINKTATGYGHYDLIENDMTLYISGGIIEDLTKYNTKYNSPLAPTDSNDYTLFWKIKKLTTRELKIETTYKNNNYEVELYN